MDRLTDVGTDSHLEFNSPRHPNHIHIYIHIHITPQLSRIVLGVTNNR